MVGAKPVRLGVGLGRFEHARLLSRLQLLRLEWESGDGMGDGAGRQVDDASGSRAGMSRGTGVRIASVPLLAGWQVPGDDGIP